MIKTEKNPNAQDQKPPVERRRARLPQPDFTPYKNANAYPGTGYFFVGHSFNLEPCASNEEHQSKRVSAIKTIFERPEQWVAVREALDNHDLSDVMSRCERDLLHHLPETALIGPAIDSQGRLIAESFTVWRKEMRRQSA